MKIKLNYKKIGFCIFLVIAICNGCSKENDFLNAKPNQSLAIPRTLTDIQLLLNDESLFNTNDPTSLGEMLTDEFYVPTSSYLSLTTMQQNAYIFASQIYDPSKIVSEWNSPYGQVYYANTALEYLPKVSFDVNQQNLYNQLKGTAMFYRAIAFYNIVQTFALPYSSTTASMELGIPLRLTSDINVPSARSNEKQCYDQIISDLQSAYSLLPAIASTPTHPSQLAVTAFLARIELAIGNYNDALNFANQSLGLFHTLTDYNSLTPGTLSISASSFLSEDIYHTTLCAEALNLTNYVSIINPTLYSSYTTNDLRKTVFYILNSGLPYFRGTYDYKTYTYSGIATDELYLIRAECYARAGNTTAALSDLNTLLITRWKTGTFIPFTATSPTDALNQILNERKKELVFRGTRWTDLRRLNQDSNYALTITHVINNTSYSLPPNSPLYAFPIPSAEIQLGGIQQNQR
jgi:tetratricopeptide (TPR) repeat protein